MLEIKLFGATSVTSQDRTIFTADLGAVKPRQILEILALSAGSRVPKEYLADLLWDGNPPRCYLATLESYVCVLRRSLGLARGRGSTLATVMRGYVLDPAAVRVDLLDFRRHVRVAGAHEADPVVALGELEQALALVVGQLLADEGYGTWALTERETFRRELVTAASLAAMHATTIGAHEVAVRTARQAIASDVLAEQAWRLLMRALWAAGRPTEALRTFFELRDHLATELGTDPAVESQHLYLEILRDADGDHRSGARDAREEVRVLMHLLRQAVASIPGVEQPRSNHALARVAADLVV